MASRSKRVLVTGADGFTGRYLIPALEAAGWETCGLVQQRGQMTREAVADLLDADALTAVMAEVKPDAVIHLAGIAFVGHGDALGLYQVNMFGTLNLMAAIRNAGLAPKVILASSANVYGTPLRDKIDESVCPAPVNHYAMSKLAMEHMVRGHFEELEVLIARPFNYTGWGQDKNFLVPKIVDHFRRKTDFIELGNLDVARDFLDVRDVAAAYVRLLEGEAAFDVVNICSGDVVSLEQIIAMSEEITGHRMEVRVNPAFVRKNEIKRLAGDNSRLKQVGWTRRHAFNETLNWMLTAA